MSIIKRIKKLFTKEPKPLYSYIITSDIISDCKHYKHGDTDIEIRNISMQGYPASRYIYRWILITINGTSTVHKSVSGDNSLNYFLKDMDSFEKIDYEKAKKIKDFLYAYLDNPEVGSIVFNIYKVNSNTIDKDKLYIANLDYLIAAMNNELTYSVEVNKR